MKPENLKVINRSKGEARVKTMIRAHLYWLSGFPYKLNESVYWCCPAIASVDMQKISVTSKMISKAHRIINELRRDYPVALPRVVGNVSLWEKRCKEYLEAVKIMNHNKPCDKIQSLFSTEDREFSKLHSKFEIKDLNSPLGIANSWMYYIHRDNLNKSYEFISKYRLCLLNEEHADIVLQSKLCRIYILDSSKTSGLLSLFTSSTPISTATKDGRAYLNSIVQYRYRPQKNNHFRLPIRPKNDTVKPILAFVDWLLEVNSKQRKRALELLDSVEFYQLVYEYQLWWQSVDKLVSKMVNLVTYPDVKKTDLLRSYQETLEGYLAKFPENFDTSLFFDYVAAITEKAPEAEAYITFFKRFSKFNDLISEDKTNNLKPCFVIYFKECLDSSEISLKYFVEYLSTFSYYLEHCEHSSAIAPWGKLRSNYWSSCEYKIFRNLKAHQLSEFFSTLDGIRKTSGMALSRDWFGGISKIVSSGFEKEQAVELSIRFIKLGKTDEISSVPLNIAKEQNFSLDNCCKLIRIWNKFDEEYTGDDTLEIIYQTFKSAESVNIFNQLIFSPQLSILRHCSNQIRVIKKVSNKERLPSFDLFAQKNEQWMQTYPREFHGTLSKLAFYYPSAEKKALKTFLKYWWPKRFLEEELTKLRTQLKSCEETQKENINLRVENFKQRLERFAPPTKQTSEKIEKVLSSSLTQGQVNFWVEELNRIFKSYWATFLGLELEKMPHWLLEEEMIRYLLPIADFNDTSKKLAKLVIKQRCYSNDWLFLEHPKNVQFLQKLDEQGFSTQVWCDGIGDFKYRSKSSKNITINLVTDPLRILNMGGHFKTCLSPGSFNYFSVFSNITDINKRVIYGTCPEGKVIGRVLVGLMASGGVKIFNVYTHHSDDEFHSNVLAYIKSWVSKAGFTLTDKGEISNLVCSEWYDDGAISVDNNIACLSEGSRFRKKLLTFQSENLYKELENALFPLPVNELTFPLIVRLPEIDERPNLMPAFIKIAESIKRLGDYETVYLFNKAYDLNHGEQCFYVFKSCLQNMLSRTVRNDNWFDTELALRVADYNPSFTLRLVKKQGSYWNRDWQKNLYAATAKVAVKSLNLLNRSQQAKAIAELYKIPNH